VPDVRPLRLRAGGPRDAPAGLNSLHSFEKAIDDRDGGGGATGGSGASDGDERGGVAATVASFALGMVHYAIRGTRDLDKRAAIVWNGIAA
jgi:hypothetical protein